MVACLHVPHGLHKSGCHRCVSSTSLHVCRWLQKGPKWEKKIQGFDSRYYNLKRLGEDPGKVLETAVYFSACVDAK